MEAAKARRADADQRLRRFQAAIAAGVDPAAVVDGINQAQAERTAAQAEIDSAPSNAVVLDVAEVYAMIDSLGDVTTVLSEAKPASLQRLYQALNVEVRYEPAERAAYVSAEPRVDSACVRGGELRTNHTPHAGLTGCVVATRPADAPGLSAAVTDHHRRRDGRGLAVRHLLRPLVVDIVASGP